MKTLITMVLGMIVLTPPTFQQWKHPKIKASLPHSCNAKSHAPCSTPNNIPIPLNSKPYSYISAIPHSQHPVPSSTPSDTLPDLQALHSSIDAYFHAQTHLQLLEFKDSKKGEWLKFLPNLGITYALDGQPRPSISLSSGILYQSKKSKQQNAAKRQRIIQQQLQAAEQAKNQLADLILQYDQLQNEYRTQQELLAIETDLFLIKQDEYERQELAPSGYLQAKRTYLLQQQALEQKRHQLDRLCSKIRFHCHY